MQALLWVLTEVPNCSRYDKAIELPLAECAKDLQDRLRWHRDYCLRARVPFFTGLGVRRFAPLHSCLRLSLSLSLSVRLRCCTALHLHTA